MNRLSVALAAVTLIRLVVAATAPLAPDETYYWVWSHALAPGYLDHPPMVALWIKAGTLVFGQTALGVRAIGPLAAAVASWMLFDAGRVLFPGTKAGVVAAVLLNATLLLGVGTVIMTPDSPLLFFWTATLWAMARLVANGSGISGPGIIGSGISGSGISGPGITGPGISGPGGWWLVAGVFGGLALDSKYSALFLWVGIGLWVLLVPAARSWLRRWQPWTACAIGLALFAPVLAWNADHGWAGFAKQGGRVNDWQPARAAGFLAELMGGQIGLATPLVWALCMIGLVVAIRRAWKDRDPGWSLLVALSLPPVLVFVQHAVGDRVQGNWPAIIYPALAVAAGGALIPKRWWVGASGLGFAITALVYVQATTSLFLLPPKLDPIAMRLSGWNGLAEQVGRKAVNAAFIAVDGYAIGSELAWWLPPRTPVVGMDERWTLTTLPTAQIRDKVGLLIRDARRDDRPDATLWSNIERIGTLKRPGASGPDFAIFRAMSIGPAGVSLPSRAR